MELDFTPETITKIIDRVDKTNMFKCTDLLNKMNQIININNYTFYFLIKPLVSIKTPKRFYDRMNKLVVSKGNNSTILQSISDVTYKIVIADNDALLQIMEEGKNTVDVKYRFMAYHNSMKDLRLSIYQGTFQIPISYEAKKMRKLSIEKNIELLFYTHYLNYTLYFVIPNLKIDNYKLKLSILSKYIEKIDNKIDLKNKKR